MKTLLAALTLSIGLLATPAMTETAPPANTVEACANAADSIDNFTAVHPSAVQLRGGEITKYYEAVVALWNVEDKIIKNARWVGFVFLKEADLYIVNLLQGDCLWRQGMIVSKDHHSLMQHAFGEPA